jgi:hypothetical protein
MSSLTTGSLRGLPVNNNIITIPSGHTLYAPGMIAQVQYVRSDSRTTYASASSGDGTTITALNLNISPKFSNSLLLMQWMINYEVSENNGFVIHRNGTLITSPVGYTGYNSEAGNVGYSAIAVGSYDQNTDSTPANIFLQYAVPAISTTNTTYAPAVRNTGGAAITFYLNRVAGSTGAGNYENMVSTGTIWEIMQ